MMIQSNLSSISDDDSCGLYVHLQPANALQNIAPVTAWLETEYQARAVFRTSFFIDADELYEENNVHSFAADLADFLGHQYPGLEVAICPTSSVHHFSYDPPDE